jgi:hypothetical protein
MSTLETGLAIDTVVKHLAKSNSLLFNAITSGG